jgi:hypothetical protein
VSVEAMQWLPGSPANQVIFTAIRACTVIGIQPRVEVAGTGGAATGTVVKAASGTAISAGTALHTGTFNIAGTAATNQALTLAAAGVLAIPAGTSVGLILTGTLTSAVGAVTLLVVSN